MLAVGKGPPAPFSESWHWDWLSGEGQPANGGSFLRSCGWRRQSSEVLYVTYQHGLPFNQRVERKDKVKPSSLGIANQKDFTTKPCKGRQESETRNRFAIIQIAPSEKEVEGLKWSEGMSQSDLGKILVECLSKLCLKTHGALYHLSDRCCFHIWVCSMFLADKSSALQVIQPFETSSTLSLAQVWWHFLQTWHRLLLWGIVSGTQWRNLPGRLDQCLVLFTFQDLKVHDDNLEW